MGIFLGLRGSGELPWSKKKAQSQVRQTRQGAKLGAGWDPSWQHRAGWARALGTSLAKRGRWSPAMLRAGPREGKKGKQRQRNPLLPHALGAARHLLAASPPALPPAGWGRGGGRTPGGSWHLLAGGLFIREHRKLNHSLSLSLSLPIFSPEWREISQTPGSALCSRLSQCFH